jgi:hypothetical protein
VRAAFINAAQVGRGKAITQTDMDMLIADAPVTLYLPGGSQTTRMKMNIPRRAVESASGICLEGRSVMARPNMNRQTTYRCEQFDRHLCYQFAIGMYPGDSGVHDGPTAHPKYRCTHCGRTAQRRGSLCRPAML